jgi:WD40 repeat protein
MPPPHETAPSPSGEAATRPDRPVERFRDAWQRGERPVLGDYLGRDDDPEHLALLAELVRVDLEQRLKAGEPARVESYVKQYPELAHNPEVLLDLIALEFAERRRSEPGLGLYEYRLCFPQFAEQLSRYLEAVTPPVTDPGSTGPLPEAVPPGAPVATSLSTACDPERGAQSGNPPPVASDWPQIPGHQIVGELGRGGMGIVYKALHTRLNRWVALKVIRKDRLSSPEAVERFHREAKKAALLMHPNIVIVWDADQAGDVHYYTMEYIEGIDLARLLQQRGPFPVWQACYFIRQAALGLQHAHEKGLVHRDIKPANLIVAQPPGEADATTEFRPGQSGVLKILDLGLARLYRSDNPELESTLTGYGSVMGTIDYMAPEQAQDARSADIRADVYSLGCTLYHLLTGQVPFPGDRWIDKIDGHRWNSPRPVRELRRDVTAGVAEVVARMMAKRPDDRYQTPAEVATALEPFTELREPTSGVIRLSRLVNLYRRLDGHDGWVESVTFSPDGQHVLSGSADQTVRVWAATSGQEVQELLGHHDIVMSVAFAPDGRLAASGGFDRTVRIWDTVEGRQLCCLDGQHDLIWSVAFTPDGRHVLAASGGREIAATGIVPGPENLIRLWDVETGREVRRFAGPSHYIASVACSPDGRRLLAGSGDQHVYLWDLESGILLCRLAGHADAVLGVAFCPDGRRALSASSDQTVRVWDLESGHEVYCLTGHVGGVNCVACSPDGLQAVSGGADHTILQWDLETGQRLRRLRGHTDFVLSVTFSPDGQHILSGSADKTLRLLALPRC